MIQQGTPDPSLLFRKSAHFILAFFWITGFLCGIFIYNHSKSTSIALIQSIFRQAPSFSNLLHAATFPFLFAYFAVTFSKPALLFATSFLEAFLFSFTLTGVALTFRSAWWLFQYFLIFSSCATAPVLYWFCLRHLVKCSIVSIREMLIILCLIFLYVCIDYCIITPFRARLIN